MCAECNRRSKSPDDDIPTARRLEPLCEIGRVRHGCRPGRERLAAIGNELLDLRKERAVIVIPFTQNSRRHFEQGAARHGKSLRRRISAPRR